MLRTSHCHDLGVTLWMYAARICDQKENEKLQGKGGGKFYKLLGLYLHVFLNTRLVGGPIFSANNLLSQHNISLTVRDITTCVVTVLTSSQIFRNTRQY